MMYCVNLKKYIPVRSETSLAKVSSLFLLVNSIFYGAGPVNIKICYIGRDEKEPITDTNTA